MANPSVTVRIRLDDIEEVADWINAAKATMYEVAGEIGAVLESFEDDPLVKEHRAWFESMIKRLEKAAHDPSEPEQPA